ncbi:MAG: hypothetical protein JWM67_2531 [Mycobacterium sp.]|nr:hypothetical protein [Mycobacterium sp.]
MLGALEAHGGALDAAPADAGAWVGPVIALGVVVLLLVPALRWTYSGARRAARRALEPPYGLLVPVVELTDAAEVARSRSVLAAHGIRTTTAPGADPGSLPVHVTSRGEVLPPPEAAGVQVLVFSDDAERARRLLLPS